MTTLLKITTEDINIVKEDGALITHTGKTNASGSKVCFFTTEDENIEVSGSEAVRKEVEAFIRDARMFGTGYENARVLARRERHNGNLSSWMFFV